MTLGIGDAHVGDQTSSRQQCGHATSSHNYHYYNIFPTYRAHAEGRPTLRIAFRGIFERSAPDIECGNDQHTSTLEVKVERMHCKNLKAIWICVCEIARVLRHGRCSRCAVVGVL